jgi:hypothetical protein
MGELDKWVPTSSKRFAALDGSSAKGVRVTLKCAQTEGGNAERLTLTAFQPVGDSDGTANTGDWLIRTVDVACPAASDTRAVCIGSC